MFNWTKDKVIQPPTMTKYKVEHPNWELVLDLATIPLWQHSPPLWLLERPTKQRSYPTVVEVQYPNLETGAVIRKVDSADLQTGTAVCSVGDTDLQRTSRTLSRIHFPKMRIEHSDLKRRRVFVEYIPSPDLKTASLHRIQTADLNAPQVCGHVGATDLKPVNVIRALITSTCLDAVYGLCASA